MSRRLLWIAVAGLLVRLVIIFATDGSRFDIVNYQHTLDGLRAGGFGAYGLFDRVAWPYGPGWFPWLLIAGELNHFISFAAADRIGPALCDTAIVVLVGHLAPERVRLPAAGVAALRSGQRPRLELVRAAGHARRAGVAVGAVGVDARRGAARARHRPAARAGGIDQDGAAAARPALRPHRPRPPRGHHRDRRGGRRCPARAAALLPAHPRRGLIAELLPRSAGGRWALPDPAACLRGAPPRGRPAARRRLPRLPARRRDQPLPAARAAGAGGPAVAPAHRRAHGLLPDLARHLRLRRELLHHVPGLGGPVLPRPRPLCAPCSRCSSSPPR